LTSLALEQLDDGDLLGIFDGDLDGDLLGDFDGLFEGPLEGDLDGAEVD
jgi:hypothetical protein